MDLVNLPRQTISIAYGRRYVGERLVFCKILFWHMGRSKSCL